LLKSRLNRAKQLGADREIAFLKSMANNIIISKNEAINQMPKEEIDIAFYYAMDNFQCARIMEDDRLVMYTAFTMGIIAEGCQPPDFNISIDAFSVASKIALEIEDYSSYAISLSKCAQNLTAKGGKKNLLEAIDHYERVLDVYTKENTPEEYASTLKQMSRVYLKLSTEEKNYLPEAANCLQEVLAMYPKEESPEGHARAHFDIGELYWSAEVGDRQENLLKAIEHYEKTLEYFTEDEFPQQYAAAQMNIAEAFWAMPDGIRGENLKKALQRYENSMRICKREGFDRYYIGLKTNIAGTYKELSEVDDPQYMEPAVNHYKELLTIVDKANDPYRYATLNLALGNLYARQATNDERLLEKAIDCFSEGKTIFTPQTSPDNYADIQINLGVIKSRFYDDEAVLLESVDLVNEALEYLEANKENFPTRYAFAQNNLGEIYKKLATYDSAYLKKAIECYENALPYFPQDTHPKNYANLQRNLAEMYKLVEED
jgi:tetratricopeptide (TPR) repeat protein